MSSELERQLRAKRHQLRACETRVRRADGSVRIEGGDGSASVLPADGRYGFVVDTSVDERPACVLDGWLFVGSQDAVCGRSFDEHGLTCVLSIGIEAPPANVTLLCSRFLPCLDVPETDLRPVLRAADAQLDECRRNGHRVLVHCNAGVSRSVSVVIGYLMRTQRIGFANALAAVRLVRPSGRPNDGFARQLRAMEAELLNDVDK